MRSRNEPGNYRVVGEPISHGYQGIAFRKDDTAAARGGHGDVLRAMIADGTYKAILDEIRPAGQRGRPSRC